MKTVREGGCQFPKILNADHWFGCKLQRDRIPLYLFQKRCLKRLTCKSMFRHHFPDKALQFRRVQVVWNQQGSTA